MRATVHIFVNEPKRDKAVRKALAAAEITSAESADGFWQIALDGESEQLPHLKQALLDAGIEYFSRREHVYTDEELAGFPLLSFFVRTGEQGLGGPSYGTMFDLNQACPACGTGARQTSPLFLDRSETPRRGDLFQTLDGQILVSQSLAEALGGAGLAALSLEQARDHRTGEPIPWHQLLLVQELPPWHPDSVGFERENECPQCRRDGHFHTGRYPFELVYTAAQLDKAPDVAWTYERFGNSKLLDDFSESHFAAPQLLVSPRFRDVLAGARVRKVDFLPVRAAE